MPNPKLRCELLETRTVPATFGIPWSDPTRLTLSFAGDGTAIAGRSSNLFSSLNAVSSPNEWQLEILRAFHAWSVHTNFDVAVIGDDGSRFGAPGRLQGDSRFGDVRIGGNTLSPDVLAIASPPDPALAGTLSGDIFVNTKYRFDGSPYNLYRVMLHEAGHAFGLDHSSDPNSPMFAQFNNTATILTEGDVNAIRTLYGLRMPDRHEGADGNETILTASAIPVPAAYIGLTPLLAFADLTTEVDADVLWFDTVPGRGDDEQDITIRVQSDGLSLVAPKVTVHYIDSTGNVQEVANATADAADFTGATISVTFDGNDDDDGSTRRYFVRIEDAVDAPFRIGRYALAVTFDGVSTVPPNNLGTVIRGPYQTLGPETLAALLNHPTGTLVNFDGGTNDSLGMATSLSPTRSFNGSSRFEAIGSIATSTDLDYYRIVAPEGGTTRTLTVNAWALPQQLVRPRIELYDGAGVRMASEVLVNDSGTFTVQSSGFVPGAVYYLRLAGDPATGSAGNYYVTADFGLVATSVVQFAQGPIFGDGTRIDRLYIGQSQLFHFVLSAAWAGGVQMILLDRDGKSILKLTAGAGDSVSAPAVLLVPGPYTIRFAALSTEMKQERTTGAVYFRLRGNRISDPIGPVLDDPTLQPEYADPNNPGGFVYPGDYVSLNPFYWVFWNNK